ncbi:DUF6086 family protein [Streptomyces lydicus]
MRMVALQAHGSMRLPQTLRPAGQPVGLRQILAPENRLLQHAETTFRKEQPAGSRGSAPRRATDERGVRKGMHPGLPAQMRRAGGNRTACCPAAPTLFKAFVGALLAWHRRTSHAVMVALSEGFVATVLVLAERVDTSVHRPCRRAARCRFPEGGQVVSTFMPRASRARTLTSSVAT